MEKLTYEQTTEVIETTFVIMESIPKKEIAKLDEFIKGFEEIMAMFGSIGK